MSKKTILVCGAGGFIGGVLSRRPNEQGHKVIGADLKEHEYFVDVWEKIFTFSTLLTSHPLKSYSKNMNILMKFTNLPRTWAVQVIFSQEKMISGS